jgi:crotonobetainyl-CoA:carnitine CoA-transferase CaiB-like acyl-CoA transferase
MNAPNENVAPLPAPLAGYRVLEMGSTVAGPFCGRLLADFGAEVIKIETPDGDPVRTMGKRFHGKSLYAASIFRNKSLISIDLRTEEGQRLVGELAAKCDVVVENFRPGGLEKWGLGYADLSARNPGLVMARISGFGQDGPYSQRAGYGVIGEAVSGLRHLTGDPDRPPARVAVSMTDYITGLYAAFGVALALLARTRTGRGQVIDAALYECAFSFMEPWIPAFEKLGHVASRCGSRLPESTPNNLYPTGDGEFIHITAMGDTVFRRLVEVMAQPELITDARFATATARSTHHEALDDLIARWTGRHRSRTSSGSWQRPACPPRASSRSPTSSATRTTARAARSPPRRTMTSARWRWPTWCRACRPRRAPCVTPATASARTRTRCCAICSACRMRRSRRLRSAA